MTETLLMADIFNASEFYEFQRAAVSAGLAFVSSGVRRCCRLAWWLGALPLKYLWLSGSCQELRTMFPDRPEISRTLKALQSVLHDQTLVPRRSEPQWIEAVPN